MDRDGAIDPSPRGWRRLASSEGGTSDDFDDGTLASIRNAPKGSELMSEDALRIRMQEIFAAMADNDLQPLFDAMADDIEWQWMGVNAWSRTFRGKSAVLGELFAGVEQSIGTSSVDVHHIHVDGEHVVVEHTGKSVTHDGRPYENRYCWVCRFREGALVELREYMDTQLVTDTFGTS